MIVLLLLAFGATAQTQEPAPEKDEMRYKLNESGSHYLKFTFLNQLWLRQTETNPGTLVMGEAASKTFDIGLRRTRFQFYASLIWWSSCERIQELLMTSILDIKTMTLMFESLNFHE